MTAMRPHSSSSSPSLDPHPRRTSLGAARASSPKPAPPTPSPQWTRRDRRRHRRRHLPLAQGRPDPRIAAAVRDDHGGELPCDPDLMQTSPASARMRQPRRRIACGVERISVDIHSTASRIAGGTSRPRRPSDDGGLEARLPSATDRDQRAPRSLRQAHCTGDAQISTSRAGDCGRWRHGASVTTHERRIRPSLSDRSNRHRSNRPRVCRASRDR